VRKERDMRFLEDVSLVVVKGKLKISRSSQPLILLCIRIKQGSTPCYQYSAPSLSMTLSLRPSHLIRSYHQFCFHIASYHFEFSWLKKQSDIDLG